MAGIDRNLDCNNDIRAFAQGSYGVVRGTPGDDVVEAIKRLNRALLIAAADGWDISLSLISQPVQTAGGLGLSPFVDAGPESAPALGAKITRTV